MLTLKAPKMKLVKTANGVGPDEAAHLEPPHKELQFASSFTMAQIAHFSFPYYFTIPNSEF